MKKKLNVQTRKSFVTYALLIVVVIAVEILLNTGNISSMMQGLLVPICVYAILAVSLNLTVGILGELSLGQAGFMCRGAYASAIFSNMVKDSITQPMIRFPLAILIGGICAALFGILIGIPVLRLRGDYLAIVTLAFGEIIKNVFAALYIGYDSAGLHISLKSQGDLNLAADGKMVINGALGISGTPNDSTFFIGFILILITLFIVLNLIHSRDGRAIMAIRDNRIAAESVGIGVTKYKLTTFIISAVLAGMAGALYAMNFSTVAAKKFDFNTSILILVFVVLGGMGNIVGSIVATTILYMLPEILREFADYRMLLYAIVLIIVMIATNSEKAIQFRDSVMAKLSSKKRKSQNDSETKEAVNNE